MRGLIELPAIFVNNTLRTFIVHQASAQYTKNPGFAVGIVHSARYETYEHRWVYPSPILTKQSLCILSRQPQVLFFKLFLIHDEFFFTKMIQLDHQYKSVSTGPHKAGK